MGVEPTWLVEGQVIYAQYSGTTNAEEMRTSLYQMLDHFHASDHAMVHIVVDIGDISIVHDPRDSLQVLRTIKAPDNLGWIIILRERSTLAKLGITFAVSLFRLKVRYFSKLKDTKTFLTAVDPSVDWEKANSQILELQRSLEG